MLLGEGGGDITLPISLKNGLKGKEKKKKKKSSSLARREETPPPFSTSSRQKSERKGKRGKTEKSPRRAGRGLFDGDHEKGVMPEKEKKRTEGRHPSRGCKEDPVVSSTGTRNRKKRKEERPASSAPISGRSRSPSLSRVPAQRKNFQEMLGEGKREGGKEPELSFRPAPPQRGRIAEYLIMPSSCRVWGGGGGKKRGGDGGGEGNGMWGDWYLG